MTTMLDALYVADGSVLAKFESMHRGVVGGPRISGWGNGRFEDLRQRIVGTDLFEI